MLKQLSGLKKINKRDTFFCSINLFNLNSKLAYVWSTSMNIKLNFYWLILSVFFYQQVKLWYLETHPLESSWLCLHLEKYCYNTFIWHTLIDQREGKKGWREARKLHTVGSYRETSEGLWYLCKTWLYTRKNKNEQRGSNENKRVQPEIIVIFKVLI